MPSLDTFSMELCAAENEFFLEFKQKEERQRPTFFELVLVETSFVASNEKVVETDKRL